MDKTLTPGVSFFFSNVDVQPAFNECASSRCRHRLRVVSASAAALLASRFQLSCGGLSGAFLVKEAWLGLDFVPRT